LVVSLGRNDLDITNREKTMAVIDREKPSIVLHCAAWTNVDGCELDPEKAINVNAGGTRIVAEACREHSALMVYFSTDYVFDGAKTAPYVETDTPNPQSVYGKSKLAGEEGVRSILADYIIMRTSWLYGAYGRNFVETMLKFASGQKAAPLAGQPAVPIKVVNDQIGCPTWTSDIARQVGLIIEKRLRGTIHVASRGEVSWFGLADEIFKYRKLDVLMEAITSETLARPAPRPRYSVMANQRLSQAGCNIMPHYRDSLHTFLGAHLEHLV
jgi:dTDP-4-dehydrorhamnose reductase